MTTTGELVLLKLGGSLITDKTREATPRRQVIARVAREIRATLAERPQLRLLAGHGSGSFGHFPAHRHGTREGVRSEREWRGFVETAAAAARLHRLVVEAFLEAGLPVMSFQPSSSALCVDGELRDMAADPMERALSHGLLPLVYGDVALDEERGGTIISTEQIFAFLAARLKPRRIIVAGEVEGVFTSDPHRDPEARSIPRITPENIDDVRIELSGSRGVDVTGGMAGKIEDLWRLVSANPEISVQVVSGLNAGSVARALNGEIVGTVLEGRDAPL